MFEDCRSCTHHTAILINSGRLMLLPWSFLISVWLFIKTIGEKVLLSMISLCPKGRCIEQVLKTDIWVDFMFIVILLYSVSITTLNSKQPHVYFVWAVHCRRSNYSARYENRTYVYAGKPRHTVPEIWIFDSMSFTTIRIGIVLQSQMALQTTIER